MKYNLKESVIEFIEEGEYLYVIVRNQTKSTEIR
jgi:hypothetical protein